MFIGLTALALSIADRSGRWIWRLKPVVGFAWMLLLVLPWFVAIVAEVRRQLLRSGARPRHARQGDERAGGAWRAAGHLPASCSSSRSGRARVLAAPAVPAIWQARREPGARFLLAWLVPSWIVFEIVITKLPHYVLPLYPAIAILIAGILEAGALAKYRWMIRGTVGWFLFPAVISLVAVVALRHLQPRAWPACLADRGGGGDPRRCSRGGSMRRTGRSDRCCARWRPRCSSPSPCMPITFPSIPALFPSELIASEVRSTGCRDPHVASNFSYQEPSLVFLLGTAHALHRRRRRRRIPARRRLPFRADRSAQRAQLRAARQRASACAIR